MRHRKTIISVAFLLLGPGGLRAQEMVSTTGGDAKGPGGSSSYTVGQVVYTTHMGTNGSVAQGMQQFFEISTIAGINETTANLELSIYPNPTTDYLMLKVEKTDGLNFRLFNSQGRLIESKTVHGTSTNISLENQPVATYFLKVSKDNQVVKTFRIIKNK